MLHELEYFAEWGGRGWVSLLRAAVEDFLGANLQGQRVLEIGSRYGKMSCLFALLGAEVVGVDVSKEATIMAETEARKWDVSGSTQFIHYDGNLEALAIGDFSIVFTKSVLVVMPDLDETMRSINYKLSPNGRFVFLENGRGREWMHMLRRFRHRHWTYESANYFTNHDIETISRYFSVETVKKNFFPPIYLIAGYKPKEVHKSGPLQSRTE